jgi:hypothetical protein
MDVTKTGNGGALSSLPAPEANSKDGGVDLSNGGGQQDARKKSTNMPSPLVLIASGLGAVLLIALGVVAFVFRAHLRRFIFRSEYPRVAKGVKPSTLVFLKLSDDLRKLKILRRPSDTAEDLERRFFEAFTEDEPCHPELPSLFAEFLELYLVDRFSTAENSVENYRVLRDLGARIHMLARTKYVDKAS